MKLSALAIVILALGIALGLAFRATVFEAEAQPPQPGPPQEQGRTILIAENVTVPRTGAPFCQGYTTAFEATADCRNFVVFVEMERGLTSQGDLGIRLNLSADGKYTHAVTAPDKYVWPPIVWRSVAAHFQILDGMPVVSPHTSVTFCNNSFTEDLVIVKAWLYCSR
jgi:hypothetical protein